MSYKHITINERCCIVEYLNLGWSLSKIAKELNRNKSSIGLMSIFWTQKVKLFYAALLANNSH